MDPLTHAPLAPIPHSSTHSSIVYQRSLTCASDYEEDCRLRSGIVTPTMEMGEYCLPMNGTNTNYHRAQAPFPISPPPFRLPDHCPAEAVGNTANLRPTTSSSMESHFNRHGECEEASSVFSHSKEEYSEEMTQTDKFGLSGRDPSPDSKTATGKRLASVKVSEKRRQQNRAAQRAMRERRKRAAQHQEIHMTAIMTENAILREKVTYLSNMLLSHAIAPAGHLPWSTMPPQDNLPPMLPHLSTANLPARPAPAPASSSSASPLSFQNHPIFPSANLNGTSAFTHTQPSLINYYPHGPLELEYVHQSHHVPGSRNLSCPSSSSNLSRPSTADGPVTC